MMDLTDYTHFLRGRGNSNSQNINYRTNLLDIVKIKYVSDSSRRRKRANMVKDQIINFSVILTTKWAQSK